MKRFLSFLLTFAMLISLTSYNTIAIAADSDEEDGGAGTCEVAGTITSIEQTEAVEDGFTVTWVDSANTETTEYTVKYTYYLYNADTETAEVTASGTQTVTGDCYFTATELTNGSYAKIEVTVDEDNYAVYNAACTLPAAISAYDYSYGNYSKYVYLKGKWKLKVFAKAADEANAAMLYVGGGYQITLMKKSGKVIKSWTVNTDSTNLSKKLKSFKKAGVYKVRIRPYIQTAGGEVFYGSSTIFSVVPQPYMYVTNLRTSSCKLHWEKVKGAKKYTVYIARSKKKKKTIKAISKLNFKKVKTTKSRSVSLKNLNVYKYYYYVAVVTKTKVNGKTVTSTKYYTYTIHV
ncbi:MAG: hypothetical protein K5840_00525 [Eubacterium sp.]|nr:hypothetical protein [Eubacterium sp.]